MTDRLRKLDALFAARVLGCKTALLARDGEGVTLIDDPRCNCDPFQHCDDERMGDGANLLPYTRSLDAAWEGAKLLGFPFYVDHQECGDDHEGHIPANKAIVDPSDTGDFDETNAQVADHPAEALVLACLRAVGVSEEELA